MGDAARAFRVGGLTCLNDVFLGSIEKYKVARPQYLYVSEQGEAARRGTGGAVRVEIRGDPRRSDTTGQTKPDQTKT